MVQSPSLLALPTSLVLLLHLHIMSYPHCNSPEYTTDLFDSRKPLRARTGSMEDIVAFLIKKIEGTEKYKSILGGMYPCLQPSDSVGFRTSAAKYIEALRTSIIRPALVASTSNGRLPSETRTVSVPSKVANSQSSRTKLDASQEHVSHLAAWWWSSVGFRKSLLEECTGERFEKILLALSTHALSIQIPQSSPLNPSAPTASLFDDSHSNALQDQPREYASLLAHAFDIHTQNLQAVTRLNSRTQDLLALRERLALSPKNDTDRPDTKRVLAVQASKWRDLVDAWDTTLSGDQPCKDGGATPPAEDALKWIMSIAGVSGLPTQEEQATPAISCQPDSESVTNPVEVSTIQTLPTASAHHPANVHKLGSLPVFISTNAEASRTRGTSSIFTSPALEELLSEANAYQASLKMALDTAIREGEQIKSKLDTALIRSSKIQLATHAKESSLDLWEGGSMSRLDFELPAACSSEAQDFLDTLNIIPSRRENSQQKLEDRVLEMRDSIHPPIPLPTPPYTEIPHPETPPILGQRQSKLPLTRHALSTSSSRHMPLSPTRRTPRTPRPYETSTPPTKSRSRSARKAPQTLQITQSVDRSPLSNPKAGGLEMEGDEQEDGHDSSEDIGLRTPTGPRASMPLPVIQTNSVADLISDMSLPDFSDGDLTADVTLPNEDDDDADGNGLDGEQETGNEHEVPYEGHSVTLRDILLKAGDGEDVFHLIGENYDLEEDIGDETMGWA